MLFSCSFPANILLKDCLVESLKRESKPIPAHIIEPKSGLFPGLSRGEGPSFAYSFFAGFIISPERLKLSTLALFREMYTAPRSPNLFKMLRVHER